MPRKAKPTLADQTFNLPQYGPHAKVTITYDTADAVPFSMPSPGVVIVGAHQCSPQPVPQFVGGAIAQPVPRGGNLIDITDPEYQARAAALREGGGAKPPGFSPKVLTSADLFPPGTDLNGLLDVGVAGEPIDKVT